ncbi:hypothetical protein V6N13_039802 [Hibiscus sabdariffa]
MGEFSDILSGTSLLIQTCVQIPTMNGRNEMSFIPPTSDALPSVDGQLNITTSNSICNSAAGNQSFASTILNSIYLKVAQELLNELINVQQALRQPHLDKNLSSQPKSSDGMSFKLSESVKTSSELSPAERQDLQNKKTKLLSMQDEVDRRYLQYYHQMKIVASSFDVVAGCGTAKPYTALSLQTISRHFRCLRDAISGQIQLTQKSLGENDNSSNNQGAAIPRLRYVDHQLRQQRPLQQFDVMQNAWRPQRGLPESSVSVLRAWLCEHFLHPYPKDSEKIMLARQTGLTRNQVANWFINARVHLWKPMVEEMYKKELGEMDSNFNSSLESAAKATGESSSASKDRGEELQESITSKVASTGDVQPGQVQHLKPGHIPDVELKMPISRSTFQNIAAGNTCSSNGMKLKVDQMSNHPYADAVIPSGQHDHGDAIYDLMELSGLTAGNQVSLALGLQNHENNVLPMSGETDKRGTNRVASSVGPVTVDFHFMEA